MIDFAQRQCLSTKGTTAHLRRIKVVWQVDIEGTYIDYPPHIQPAIERTFRSEARSRFTINDNTYDICCVPKKNELFQQNITTLMKRKVRFVSTAADGLPRATATTSNTNTFHRFQVFDQSWIDMSTATCIELSRAWNSGQVNTTVTFRTAHYFVDFSKMEQTNLSTSKVRKIRMCNPIGSQSQVIAVQPQSPARLVDVTAQYHDLIQDMINRTCESDNIGMGQDSHGLTHRSFRVKSVHQIQNPNLLRNYQHYKSQMGSRPGGYRKFDVLTQKCALSNESELDRRVNEVYLFHGTRYNTVDKISNVGLDARRSEIAALFGRGSVPFVNIFHFIFLLSHSFSQFQNLFHRKLIESGRICSLQRHG
eukprot:c10070_g1_i5.p1 GENE.c10070_g1_i5~~c10070_g1_i5.p1  ORF type:complete len:417 (+),score=75.09 c10070_g1_i5:159-1253(+)